MLSRIYELESEINRLTDGAVLTSIVLADNVFRLEHNCKISQFNSMEELENALYFMLEGVRLFG